MNRTSPAATVLYEVATWAGITTQPTAGENLLPDARDEECAEKSGGLFAE